MASDETYTPVHAYGGREHDQPAPIEGCLLCRLEATEADYDGLRQVAKRDYILRREFEAKFRQACNGPRGRPPA